jgi:hypothetical protein
MDGFPRRFSSRIPRAKREIESRFPDEISCRESRYTVWLPSLNDEVAQLETNRPASFAKEK